MNENEVKSRLSMALEANNESPSSLARKIGISPKRLKSQIFGNAPTPLSAILHIAEAMPGISLEWLLRGTGEMQLKQNVAANSNNYINNGNNNSIVNTVGANIVTGRYATVIGQQIIGLSENFVRELLAAKDKQIQTLLAILGK